MKRAEEAAKAAKEKEDAAAAVNQAQEAAKATNATEGKVVRGSSDEEEPEEELRPVEPNDDAPPVLTNAQKAAATRKATMTVNASPSKSGDNDGINDRMEGPRRSIAS
ncbi:hypothetical protein ARMGADRAFT_1030515 [Armillaria gallica]|uniref:Uncharacterized protein n=1 Tax=Armillaria gallica TaxID=47427 RepID=A0A2H3DH12_ARMGA|nr:hypothetical protein ARMGADRAFT_1030515 [Armillaria gallica]